MISAPGHAHNAHSRDLKNDANIAPALFVMSCDADRTRQTVYLYCFGSWLYSVPDGKFLIFLSIMDQDTCNNPQTDEYGQH